MLSLSLRNNNLKRPQKGKLRDKTYTFNFSVFFIQNPRGYYPAFPSRGVLGALVRETVKHQSIVNPHMKWLKDGNALKMLYVVH